MIGLLFFGAIALWFFIAIGLGLWLTKFVKEKWRVLAGFVLVPFVFFAPVMDEVIAYPQMMSLCHDLPPLGLVNGMNEKNAYGRAVIYRDISTPIAVFPPTVRIDRHEGIYFDAKTNEPVLGYQGYAARSAFLNIPNGSSGGSMTLLLRSCSGMKSDAKGYAIEKYDSHGLPVRFNYLNLTNVR